MKQEHIQLRTDILKQVGLKGAFIHAVLCAQQKDSFSEEEIIDLVNSYLPEDCDWDSE